MPFSLGFWAAAGGGASAAGMELISTTLLSGSQSSITFSSIPSTYKHLQIRMTTRADSGGTSSVFYVRLNSDTGSNYSRHWLRGDGSTVSANAGSGETQAWLGYTTSSGDAANIFSPHVMDILDYASTNKNKTIRHLSGAIGSFLQVGLWSAGWYNTAAVTSVTIFPTSNNFVSGSRFSLYGIKG